MVVNSMEMLSGRGEKEYAKEAEEPAPNCDGRHCRRDARGCRRDIGGRAPAKWPAVAPPATFSFTASATGR